MNLSDLRVYLPKFLSAESESELYRSLKDFPINIDQRLYTNFLKEEKVIFQGDCLKKIPVVDLTSLSKKNVDAIILSNTCDIDPKNTRNFPSNIVVSPLIKIAKYIEVLLSNGMTSDNIDDHIEAIKKQRITQIFYLPKYSDVMEESIFFFDRLYSVPSAFVDRDQLCMQRLISLSDYGSYLFLFKISMHFTRIQDKVERKSVNIY